MLIMLGRVLIFMATIPNGTLTVIEPGPPTWNLELVVEGGVEIVSALAGVCVVIGIMMLCQEPRNLPKKYRCGSAGASSW
jgi:hypothetical protein